jgi:hypothetical protein
MKKLQSAFKTSFVISLFVVTIFSVYSQSWSPMGGGTGWGNAVCVYNNELYAGGTYGIRKWDGYTWVNVGGGINGEVFSLAVLQGELYAGGNFTLAGNLEIPFIARWDGSNWSDLGGSPNSLVRCLTVHANKLIIGGYFIQCENMPANHIIEYDGNHFSLMGTGTGGSQGQVMALTSYGNDLVAGGFFTTAGGMSANHIAKWNGTAWSPLGAGIGGIVYGLGTHNGNLIAGGLFTTAGGISANAIASWDGSSWSALGSGCSGGFYPYVYSIVSFNGYLYSGGLYTIAGGQTVNGIAKWDGSNWSGLGSGFYNGGSNVYGARGLAIFNNELVATGIFSSAGGVGAGNIAKWDGLLTALNNNNGSIPDNFSLSQNYPNPFNPSTKIDFSIPKSGHVKLNVYDETGRAVSQLVNEHLNAGSYSYSFNAAGLSSGVYFYRIITGEFTETRKMILTK